MHNITGLSISSKLRFQRQAIVETSFCARVLQSSSDFKDFIKTISQVEFNGFLLSILVLREVENINIRFKKNDTEHYTKMVNAIKEFSKNYPFHVIFILLLLLFLVRRPQPWRSLLTLTFNNRNFNFYQNNKISF